MAERHGPKGSVVLREHGGAKDCGGRSMPDKTAGGVAVGDGGPWKLVSPTSWSTAAAPSRSLLQFPPPSPMSPSSPPGMGATGLSTAMPVEQLYRIPAALYRGGPIQPGFPLASSSAAAVDKTPSGRSHGPSGAHAQDQLSPLTAAALLPQSAPVAERVRRAAQAFASDAGETAVMRLLLGNEEVVVGGGTDVRVERGYRCLPSSSSPYGSDEKATQHMRNSSHALVPHHDGYDDGWVVPLLIGTKRCRGCARGFACAETVAQNEGDAHGCGGGIRSLDPSSARLLTSPSATSLPGFPSPQSPAIPPRLGANAAAAPPASSTAAVARPSRTKSNAVVTTTTYPAATASAPPSPFQSLLDLFSEAHAGQAAMAMRMNREGATRASVSRDGYLTTPSDTCAEAVLQAQPWLRIWASRGLSKHLAAQLERDAYVLKARPVNIDETSAEEGPSQIAIATAAVTASGVDRSGASSRAGTAFARMQRPPPPLVPSEGYTSAAAPPPQSLYDALLQLFDMLEQLEEQTAHLFLATAPASAARGGVREDARAASPVPQGALCRTATAASFPSCPPQSVKELFGAVVRQWCDVLLLRWPSDPIALGYVEWWLRHSVWNELMGASAIHTKARAPASMTEDTSVEAQDAQEASRQQQGEHFHILRAALADASSEGMRRLFDSLVDAFVLIVQELLRCCSGVGAALQAHDSWKARCSKVGSRCRELLRVLTSLYLDPPGILQQVFREVPMHTPSSPIPVASANFNGEGVTLAKNKEVEAGSSSAASPSSPANVGATHAEVGQLPDTSSSNVSLPPPPQQQQQQRHQADGRSRVRQLHYQLLYAVCRLCNALPLSWAGVAASSPGSDVRSQSAERVGPMDFVNAHSSFMSSFSSFHSDHTDYLELFAAAVQLAAAVAVPLSKVQLPMKGDLLCVTSRLAQQRLLLLQRGWLSEREYTRCMGLLRTLLMQAT